MAGNASVKKAIVVGASGFAGRELCGLLNRHPGIALIAAVSARMNPAGPSVATTTPPQQAAVQAPLPSLDLDALDRADVVFLCTPHGLAAPLAQEAYDRGTLVVDLSADLRLKDAGQYEQVYGNPHPAPALLNTAVYGLTERTRAQVAEAQVVANPGCYPTSILLPLQPLLDAGLIDVKSPIVADSKSGVSGAGKTPNETTHFANVHENFRAYGIGDHRHGPEISQETAGANVVFVPHLLPCLRGILTTLYITPSVGVDAQTVRTALQDAYASEPFLRILDQGTPQLKDVVHTNDCHMAVHSAGPLVVITSAIDNLLKGAAGQALQNANTMLGLEETLGLPRATLFAPQRPSTPTTHALEHPTPTPPLQGSLS